LGVAGVCISKLWPHYLPFANAFIILKPHDAIDFTDNDIQLLGNFPLSPRLRTLLLARNRVTSIQPSLANSLPNLTTLVLAANNFIELADLDVLSGFGRLVHLVLMENPVSRKDVSRCPWGKIKGAHTQTTDGIQHYRGWIIWRCPTVRFLDYKKVKDVERQKAKDLFGTMKEPSVLASKVHLLISLVNTILTGIQIMGVKTKTFDTPSANGIAAASSSKNYRVKLTDKERKKVEELIRNAKSLQDIQRLEKELNEGRVPAAAQNADDPMEE
jgi:U2 small nuclear ribonucleoprotein A'